VDDCVAVERYLLGSILGAPTQAWPATAEISVNDFLLSSHRLIYAAMAKLAEDGEPIDVVLLPQVLGNDIAEIGGIEYLSSLVDGCVPENIAAYVRHMRRAALHRTLKRKVENLDQGISNANFDLTEIAQDAQDLLDTIHSDTVDRKIKNFAAIPDIFSININPAEFLVPHIVARKTMTLIAGLDGVAKSQLAMKLAIAVATGGNFIGFACGKAPVLFLDYENPDFEIVRRMKIMAGGSVPDLKIWGTWLDEQPPQIGNDLLLQISKEMKPLIIVDPFRDAHDDDENDSLEMKRRMKALRTCATAGASVLLLHHTAKAEGSDGRGSTAIRAACDIRFVQEMDPKDGSLITLRCGKNRLGKKLSMTIRVNFEEGVFERTDSAEFDGRQQQLMSLRKIIEESPGLTQNGVCGRVNMKKTRAMEFLKAEDGRLWCTKQDGKAVLYYPIKSGGSPTGELMGTDDGGSGSPLLRGTDTTAVPDSGNHSSVPPTNSGELAWENCDSMMRMKLRICSGLRRLRSTYVGADEPN